MEPPTFAWSNDLLLLVHVVLVALDVAASALQSRRRLEHVPQRLGACLTVGGEVVEGGDELVALVADVARLLSNGQRLGKLWLLFALALIGVKDLERGRDNNKRHLEFQNFNSETNRRQC